MWVTAAYTERTQLSDRDVAFHNNAIKSYSDCLSDVSEAITQSGLRGFKTAALLKAPTWRCKINKKLHLHNSDYNSPRPPIFLPLMHTGHGVIVPPTPVPPVSLLPIYIIISGSRLWHVYKPVLFEIMEIASPSRAEDLYLLVARGSNAAGAVFFFASMTE